MKVENKIWPIHNRSCYSQVYLDLNFLSNQITLTLTSQGRWNATQKSLPNIYNCLKWLKTNSPIISLRLCTIVYIEFRYCLLLVFLWNATQILFDFAKYKAFVNIYTDLYQVTISFVRCRLASMLNCIANCVLDLYFIIIKALYLLLTFQSMSP